MSKASNESLENLHDLLATTLAQAIKEGIPVTDSEGKVHRAPAGAAILNVARQFLKDNNIDSVPKAGNPLDLLQEAALPFGGGNEVVPFKKKMN